MGKFDESKLQQAVIRWWSLAHYGLGVVNEDDLMSFPLQGVRSKANGARMKAEGMRKGTPDMLLAVSRSGYHGLWIELKTATGSATPEQKARLASLSHQGYLCCICKGSQAAISVIDSYVRERFSEKRVPLGTFLLFP